MSKYYMFLKNSFIDFEKLIIEKYSFLGLDEVELIILIKMNKSISLNEKFSIDKLVKTMNANEDVVRNKIVDLINNQFITLQLKGNKEIYSLDDTYKRLAELLEKEDVVETKEENQSDIHKIILLLEKEFKKMLSPLELELVHKWINDDKFSYEKIYNAVLETLKLKKKNVQYVDVILNKKESNYQATSKEGLQDLFNQVYGKIK